MAGRNLFAEEVSPTPQPQGRNLLAQTAPMVPRETQPDQSFAGGVGQELLQGATLGFSDEIQSFIAAAVASPFIEDKTFGQIMQDARKSFRDQQEQFREENPNTALGAQIAGGLATGGTGLAKTGLATGGKTLAGTAGKSALGAGAVGTAAGAGFADEDELFSQETLVEAGKTGALSAILGAATPIVLRGAISAGKLVPKALPESLMETAVKIRPSVPQDKRASMVRTALDEGIMPTTKGLELIEQKITNLDQGLNKIIDAATDRGKLVSKKVLFSELKQLKKDLGGVNIRAGKNVKQIENVAAAFDQQLKKIKKDQLTPREVQNMKRQAYQQLKFDVSQQAAKFGEVEAEKAIVRGAKKSLEQIDPNVQKINLREGKLLELGDELERAVGRLDNRNLISLDTAAKVAAGAATGSPVGTGVGVASSALGAPRAKAKTALILENIRKTAEISDRVNKSLPPEAAAAFSLLVEDNKELLNELIGGLDE